MKNRYLFLLVSMLFYLQGCSNTKYYTSSLEKNLLITTKKDSGSAFSKVSIYLDIYDVNRACETNYLGSVTLSEKETRVGIPENKNSLLSFRFEGSSFLGGSRSSTSFDTLLKPRKGYQYDINASYVSGIYNVDIMEFNNKSGKKRRLDTRELHECNNQ